jgi:hypothetical protein
MTPTLAQGFKLFLSSLPECTDEVRAYITIAFASGAYAASGIAAEDPASALSQAKEMCDQCEAMVEDYKQ